MPPLLAVPVTDTVKQVDGQNQVKATLPRQGLWLAQTPQVFRRDWLTDAYANRAKLGNDDHRRRPTGRGGRPSGARGRGGGVEHQDHNEKRSVSGGSDSQVAAQTQRERADSSVRGRGDVEMKLRNGAMSRAVQDKEKENSWSFCLTKGPGKRKITSG